MGPPIGLRTTANSWQQGTGVFTHCRQVEWLTVLKLAPFMVTMYLPYLYRRFFTLQCSGWVATERSIIPILGHVLGMIDDHAFEIK